MPGEHVVHWKLKFLCVGRVEGCDVSTRSLAAMKGLEEKRRSHRRSAGFVLHVGKKISGCFFRIVPFFDQLQDMFPTSFVHAPQARGDFRFHDVSTMCFELFFDFTIEAIIGLGRLCAKGSGVMRFHFSS